MKSGQILILVLLVIVVVLAVGLSVASRNITNLRTATQTEQSQRAFSAAEGGVENVLSKISGIGAAISTGSGNVPDCTVTGQQADCRVDLNNIRAKVTVVGSKKFENTIGLGNVGQIDLGGASAGKPVKIEWARSDKVNEVTGDGPASIEITQIHGLSPFNQTRYFAPGRSDRGSKEDLKRDILSAPCPGFSQGEYNQCVIVTTLSGALILRIKPFWADTTVRVSGESGFELPVQTYDVVSTATTDIGVTRRVQVTKTVLPQLPAVFDYVLYSESQIGK